MQAVAVGTPANMNSALVALVLKLISLRQRCASGGAEYNRPVVGVFSANESTVDVATLFPSDGADQTVTALS